jgi:radical SAM/Cys-rich protein
VDAPKIAPSFADRVREPLEASGINVLQINVGYRCNLECRHCRVKAGPNRSEVMTRETMEQCLRVLTDHAIAVVDITGGSPELHPDLPWFIRQSAALKRRVLVRSNSTLLLEKAYEELLDLYAGNGVEVVLSLPHVDPGATDRQSGDGVFVRLIEAMRRLNSRGYGQAGGKLVLDLVHNPAGAYLPGSQAGLESHYGQTLQERYGIRFDHLFCITNMPVGRYLDYLLKTDNYGEYMWAPAKAFNFLSLRDVTCRSTVSVGWDGTIYDCDFNQMLGLTVDHGVPHHISAFDMAGLASRRIVVGDHCYGCTAGAGSSCRGQIA